jgi:hypothetical protein
MNKYVNLDGDDDVSSCPFCGSNVMLASVFLCTTHDEVLEIGTTEGVWQGYRDGWYHDDGTETSGSDDGTETGDSEPKDRTCGPSVTLDLLCPRCPEKIYLHIPLVRRGYEHANLDSDNDPAWWITESGRKSRQGPFPTEAAALEHIEELKRREDIRRRLRQAASDAAARDADRKPGQLSVVQESGWYVNVITESDNEIAWRSGPYATKAEADAAAKYMLSTVMSGTSLTVTAAEP